jgi:hypothetical protein
MGLRAKELFQKRRLHFDAGLTTVVKHSFSQKSINKQWWQQNIDRPGQQKRSW